jgi:transcription elongation factor GreA
MLRVAFIGLPSVADRSGVVNIGAAMPPTGTSGAEYLARMAGTQLSRDAFTRLQTELEDLKTRGRVDIARAIEAARALGDLSENGDYHAAKDTQGKMEARIRQLEAMLEDAQVVDQVATGDSVSTGIVVGLRYDGDDDVERYLIGSIEERREGVSVISPGSPLGQALMGKKVGDTVTYEAPSGALAVEIVTIGD